MKNIILINKKQHSYITIVDDIIKSQFGTLYVPVVSTNTQLNIIPLLNILENYQFPTNSNNSKIVSYLKGYNDPLLNVSFYDQVK